MSIARTDWPTTFRGTWQLLHDNGYTVIIRDGYVYLFRANAPRHCLRTEVDGGHWIAQPAVEYFITSHLYEDMAEAIEASIPALSPWRHCSAELSVETVMEFYQVARDCYCYKGVDRCDFCTGLRRPDRARWDFGSQAEAREMLVAYGYDMVAPCRGEQGEKWASIRNSGSNAGLPTVYHVILGTYKED